MLHKLQLQRQSLIRLGLCSVIGLAAAPLEATTARLASLGGGAFIEDDRNVQRWYGSLGDYPNLFVLEGGHFTLPEGWHDELGRRVSGPGLGAHVALDQSGQWGTAAVFLNDRGDDVDPGGLARDGLEATGTAMWSRRFGSVQPTLMVRHGSASGEALRTSSGPGDVVQSWKRSRTEFGLGLRWDLTAGAYLDLAGEIRDHSEQTTVTDPQVVVVGREWNSRSSVGLRSRAFLRLSPTMALVPLLEFLHEDRPVAAPSPLAGRNLDGHLLKMGSGLNWYPDPDHLLILGLDFMHGQREILDIPSEALPTVHSKQQWDSLSLTIGFESRFQYWLTFRGSFRYEPVAFAADGIGQPADFTTFMVNLGAAIQLGDYDLDLALTDQEPRSVAGYYGHSLFGNPATWVTATARRSF